MTEARIPFGTAQESSGEELSGAAPAARNIIVDPRGMVRRRPGLSTWVGAPDGPVRPTVTGDVYPVCGIHETMAGPGHVYAWVDKPRPAEEPERDQRPQWMAEMALVALGLSAHITNLTPTRHPNRIQVVETEMLLAFTGGDELWRMELANRNVARICDGQQNNVGTPYCSHVAHLAGRLLANDRNFNDGVRYSEPTTSNTDFTPHAKWDPELYGIAGYIPAEQSPDHVSALATTEDTLLVFGVTTVQAFTADPSIRFAPAGTIGVGIGAAHSIVRDAPDLLWLDNRRRIVVWSPDAGVVEVLSAPIQAELNAMAAVDDGFGYVVADRGVKLFVWTFPTDGRTFVLQKGSGWSQWSTRLASPAAADTRFRGHSAFQRTRGSETLIGTLGGRVTALDWDATDDIEGDIVCSCETGFQSRETAAYKSCNDVTLMVRRGDNRVSSEVPVLWIGYRDRPGPWTTRIPVRLGASGDSESVVHLGQQGMYNSRQWYFEYSGVESLALVSATESYTVI